MEPKEFTTPIELVDVKNREEACQFINEAYSQDPALIIFQEPYLGMVSDASYTNKRREISDLKFYPVWYEDGDIEIKEVSRATSDDALHIHIKEGVSNCYITKIGSFEALRKGVYKDTDTAYNENIEFSDRIKSVLYSTKKILEIYSLYQTYFINNNLNGLFGDDGSHRLWLINSPNKLKEFDPNLYTLSQVNRIITGDMPLIYGVYTVDGRTELKIEF